MAGGRLARAPTAARLGARARRSAPGTPPADAARADAARRPIGRSAISVTEVDRLKADPFAFYAERMLRLRALDAVDADPSAGVARHARCMTCSKRWMQGGRLRIRRRCARARWRCSTTMRGAPDDARAVAAAADGGDRLDRRADRGQRGRGAAAAGGRGQAARSRSPASRFTARSTGSTGWPTAASRSSITRPASRRRPRAVRGRVQRCSSACSALIAERGGFPGCGGHGRGVRILVAGGKRQGRLRLCRQPGRASMARATGSSRAISSRIAARQLHRGGGRMADRRASRSPPSCVPEYRALCRLRPADAARRMVRP